MERRYRQLSLEERQTIAQFYKTGKSIRQIAATLDRAPSTVSREIKRNTGYGAKAVYRANYADDQAWARRWSGCKLERQPSLLAAVLERLKAGWSPEQVSGRLAKDHRKQIISYETIYRFIYAQIRATANFKWRYYLPRAKFKRGFRGKRSSPIEHHIKHRVALSARPNVVDDRQQAGHWEVDLMMFGNKKTNLLVAQERTSRFIFIAKQADKKSHRVAAKLREWFKLLPPSMRRTLTQDNGTEFARHYLLNKSLGMKTFFCDTRSPWQKGGVENANGRIRRYVPKKADPRTLSHNTIRTIAKHLNNTPRKCLDFQTPAEVFLKQLLHFECEFTLDR